MKKVPTLRRSFFIICKLKTHLQNNKNKTTFLYFDLRFSCAIQNWVYCKFTPYCSRVDLTPSRSVLTEGIVGLILPDQNVRKMQSVTVCSTLIIIIKWVWIVLFCTDRPTRWRCGSGSVQPGSRAASKLKVEIHLQYNRKKMETEGWTQPFLPNRPRQNSLRGKELNKFCPPNRRHAPLPLLLSPSFFYDINHQWHAYKMINKW